MGENQHFGKDCPVGKVQVEFVGVSPDLKISDYGWKPSESAFLEIWVDGKRWRINVGTIMRGDGSTQRGLHVIGPADMVVDKHSLNAFDAYSAAPPSAMLSAAGERG